ncbi:MAG: hypothetical protein HPY53_01750 [Brevinematales bacterium]|nr:hypothetical protein [Brevinematales bacterium]
MKRLFFIVLTGLTVSCGSQWNYGHKTVHDPLKKSIIVGTTPSVEIHYVSAPEIALTYAEFFEGMIAVWNGYSPSKAGNIIIELGENPELYTAMFKAGTDYFAALDNKAVIFGIIQYEWEKRVLDSFTHDDFISQLLKSQQYRIIRIRDFEVLFQKFQLTRKEMDQVYRVICRYLYQQVLFISVQELMDNDPRYFNIQELDQVFSQAVTLPQMADFVRFVVERYGKDRLVEFGKVPFSTDKWSELFGEPLNNIEEEYSYEIQKAGIDGIYTNSEFGAWFGKVLALYNTTTKDTLFQK